MPAVNRCILGGYICNDPEIRLVGEKKAKMMSFRIAVNEKYKGHGVFYIRVNTFQSVDILFKFLQKGTWVVADGRLNMYPYIDKKTGFRQWSTTLEQAEITFIGNTKTVEEEPTEPPPKSGLRKTATLF